MKRPARVEEVVVYYAEGHPERVTLRCDDGVEVEVPHVIEVVETISNSPRGQTRLTFRAPVRKA